MFLCLLGSSKIVVVEQDNFHVVGDWCVFVRMVYCHFQMIDPGFNEKFGVIVEILVVAIFSVYIDWKFIVCEFLYSQKQYL